MEKSPVLKQFRNTIFMILTIINVIIGAVNRGTIPVSFTTVRYICAEISNVFITLNNRRENLSILYISL